MQPLNRGPKSLILTSTLTLVVQARLLPQRWIRMRRFKFFFPELYLSHVVWRCLFRFSYFLNICSVESLHAYACKVEQNHWRATAIGLDVRADGVEGITARSSNFGQGCPSNSFGGSNRRASKWRGVGQSHHRAGGFGFGRSRRLQQIGKITFFCTFYFIFPFLDWRGSRQHFFLQFLINKHTFRLKMTDIWLTIELLQLRRNK